jgi:hypothetical protein
MQPGIFIPCGFPGSVWLIPMRDCPGIKLLLDLLKECFVFSMAFVFWHTSQTLHNIEYLLIILRQWLLSLNTP